MTKRASEAAVSVGTTRVAPAATAASGSTFLSEPLPDVAAWTKFFVSAGIPVLADTAAAIDDLRAHQDAVDANLLGETIADDPLMTLKVLAHASTHRPSRVVTDIETVISALVMMGISPFFAAFDPQLTTVEATLGSVSGAMGSVGATLHRVHRSANFALAFAVHRMDPDAAAIHTAALLHDFAELLLWCHAPALARRIRDAQEADATLRSSTAQRAVLNVELLDVQQALMRAWRLPELLIRISDDRHADHPSVRSVLLAVRLARHTADGWSNAAISNDVDDISRLLHMSRAATFQWLRGI